MSIISIYKPKGPTSNDVVQKIKKISGIKKVGHAGTLDPLAQGVLVIGIGREATKKLDTVVRKEKEYIAKIKLGEESATDDEEGPKVLIPVPKIPSKKEIEKIIPLFVGSVLQVPPIFSAIKIKGKEAYKLARRGEKVILRPRKVNIKEIKILSYKWPYLKLKVTTGPGVYIRSLARDIGKKLKTGGYLAELERTRVGEFTKENSYTLEQFQKLF